MNLAWDFEDCPGSLHYILLKIYAKIRSGHFFVFLAHSSVICQPDHLFNTSCGFKVLTKKGLIKNFIQGKMWWNSCLFLLWTRLPKNRNGLSLKSHFCHYQNYRHVCKLKNKVKGNIGTSKKLQDYQKFKRK